MVYIKEQIDGHIIETPYKSVCIPKANISMMAKTLEDKTAIFVDGMAVIIDKDFESAVEDWRERAVIDTIE